MYDRDLLLAELEAFEIKMRSSLRQVNAARDEHSALKIYARLGALRNEAKQVWQECGQSKSLRSKISPLT